MGRERQLPQELPHAVGMLQSAHWCVPVLQCCPLAQSPLLLHPQRLLTQRLSVVPARQVSANPPVHRHAGGLPGMHTGASPLHSASPTQVPAPLQ